MAAQKTFPLPLPFHSCYYYGHKINIDLTDFNSAT